MVLPDYHDILSLTLLSRRQQHKVTFTLGSVVLLRKAGSRSYIIRASPTSRQRKKTGARATESPFTWGTCKIFLQKGVLVQQYLSLCTG